MKLTIISVSQNGKLTKVESVNPLDNNVLVLDFGSYRCVSKNSLGDTDGSIKLYREYRLEIFLRNFFYLNNLLFDHYL